MRLKILKLNKKGSVLQIVLVVFLTMSFSLTMGLSFLQFRTQHYQMIDLLMKQKNIEMMLVHYYQSQMENDILLSDDYEGEHESISYRVNNMGDYEEIETSISIEKMSYQFNVRISYENYDVLKFEYVEE